MDSILSMIKQGVKLRPADKDDKRSSQDLDILETPSDSHMRLLQESLSRINKFTRESSPESEEDSDEEDLFAWQNSNFKHYPFKLYDYRNETWIQFIEIVLNIVPYMLTNECVIIVKYWYAVLFIFIIEKLNLRITINVIQISSSTCIWKEANSLLRVIYVHVYVKQTTIF